MPKRKKYPKLPAGFGSIRYLGSGRRNPYCIQPASTGVDLNGCPIRPKPLCYVDNWYKGFAVLTAYNAGTYTPGMERSINIPEAAAADISNMQDLVKSILGNYSLIRQQLTGDAPKHEPTFAEVFEEYFNYKYVNSKKEYSASTISTIKTGFKNASVLHDRVFSSIRYADLQKVLDDCPLKHASIEHIVRCFHQMYKYAEAMEYIEKDYSKNLEIKKPDDDIHGVPFSEAEITKLWNDRNDPVAELLLIMIYSGHRISEYNIIEINLHEAFFKGGLKTHAGRDRTVPIHSAILPLVRKRLSRDGALLKAGVTSSRKSIEEYCEAHGLGSHTPHDTRHTFSFLCDKYCVREADKKRMLGHAFGADITNGVYGHRTLEDLRTEIEKIKANI